MQTIGETTNKRDFVPSQWTDILFKSLSGKTNNYTIDVKIGTKRIAAAAAATADNQDARDSPKKRRKQSNPTRISSDGDGANQNRPEHTDRWSFQRRSPSSSPLNLTTRYENGDNASADITGRPASPCPPPSGNNDGRPSAWSPSSTCPSQVFNREAFCDRCNKEFCNKYFLKTHKANKHGVLAVHCPDGGRDPSDGNSAVVPYTPSLFKSPVATVAQPPTDAHANANAHAAKHAAHVTAAAAGHQTRAYCSVCHKEFCNKYFVKRHKAKIHGITDDDGPESRTAVDDEPLNFKTAVEVENEERADETVPATAATSAAVGAPCDEGAYEGAYELGNATGTAVTDRANGCERPSCHGCDSDAWLSGADRYEDGANGGGGGGASTGSGHSAETDGQQSAALSSYCRICDKELCNKYFMKTHMQRMHGISIRHGNHIGGVVCDVCNKELCSKYFLRVHKQNSHGIAADDGAATCAKPAAWPEHVQRPAADEPAADGGHAYYRRYAEACGICFRRFRGAKWLAAHLLNDHGDEGNALWKRVRLSRRGGAADDACPAGRGRERSALKQYRCSYCPFATSVLSFLFVHEKFHLAEDKIATTAAAPAAAADDRGPESESESRAVPQPFIMQSFFLENCSVSASSAEPESAAGRSDSFHSSLVYLPVKEKLTSTVNVFFKLTPT